MASLALRTEVSEPQMTLKVKQEPRRKKDASIGRRRRTSCDAITAKPAAFGSNVTKKAETRN